MIINNTYISECVWLKPEQYKDNRGIFSEIFQQSKIPYFKPLQSNYSFSLSGVLRGIHRTPYAKLVTCVSGKVYDVCVDLRKDSPTYQNYFGLLLDSQNLYSLYIPPYCGHGFLAIEESTLIYQQGDEYQSSLDETYCYKQFNINWPFLPNIISSKDSKACD
jgi:dTDP-4-dehydrorhamnose 3,5-epimerase